MKCLSCFKVLSTLIANKGVLNVRLLENTHTSLIPFIFQDQDVRNEQMQDSEQKCMDHTTSKTVH